MTNRIIKPFSYSAVEVVKKEEKTGWWRLREEQSSSDKYERGNISSEFFLNIRFFLWITMDPNKKTWNVEFLWSVHIDIPLRDFSCFTVMEKVFLFTTREDKNVRLKKWRWKKLKIFESYACKFYPQNEIFLFR